MEQDESQGHQERRPRLVDGDHRHHHEEVEVDLDEAIEEVHQDRRGRQQPKSRERRAGRCAQAPNVSTNRECAYDRRFRERVASLLMPKHPDDRKGDHVDPQQHANPVMARSPLRLRQCAAARDHC
jgi:hypothetical protein